MRLARRLLDDRPCLPPSQLCTWCLVLLGGLSIAVPVLARVATTGEALANRVAVTFVAAPMVAFPNRTDSNSPAFWDADRFYLFNSWGGQPRRAAGTDLALAADTNPDGSSAAYDDDVAAGRWLEAVIRDDDSGLVYGSYHEETATACPQGVRYWPEIGAAVSDDDGATWDDLGLILTPRDGTVTCDTQHPVTNGGIGDFSVILDNNSDPGDHYLYFIFSSYGGDLEEQGISFARMLWTDRDQPLDPFSGESLVTKWDGDSWAAPGIGGRSIAIFHDSEQRSWTGLDNNGYWGPSVHWNVALNRFIVLMSRSMGGNYETQGIYMTYTTVLDNPNSWVAPKLIISENQGWYPQVIGDADVHGTDTLAGAQARYFNQGQSSSFIIFTDLDKGRASAGKTGGHQ